MKKILALIGFFVLLTLGILYGKDGTRVVSNFIYYSPCDAPIAYRIGKIDSRFNVTDDELLTESRQAANIWNATQNKELFEYEAKADLSINLVYDSRQELNSKIDELNTNLKQQQGSIDPQIALYKQKQADFESKLATLNENISYWNSKGGAPEDEYSKLTKQQQDLQQEADELNAQAKLLGQSTDEYNQNAQDLTKTINNYQQVLQYKPEEGVYEQDGKEKDINIYIDTSQNEFLHTLTHEMGHALGLDHNSNQDSIMYPKTTSALSPSTDDIAALNKICRKRTIFETIYEHYRTIYTYLTSKSSPAAQ